MAFATPFEGPSVHVPRSAHARVLERLINEQIEKLRDYLATGAPNEIGTYKAIVGQIQGLKDALRFSEEADK
jgi:hypothetical protein